jgi:hypothetical protein
MGIIERRKAWGNCAEGFYSFTVEKQEIFSTSINAQRSWQWKEEEFMT